MSIKIVDTKYGKVALYPWVEYADPASANMQQVAMETGATFVLLLREGKEDATVEEAEAIVAHLISLRGPTDTPTKH